MSFYNNENMKRVVPSKEYPISNIPYNTNNIHVPDVHSIPCHTSFRGFTDIADNFIPMRKLCDNNNNNNNNIYNANYYQYNPVVSPSSATNDNVPTIDTDTVVLDNSTTTVQAEVCCDDTVINTDITDNCCLGDPTSYRSPMIVTKSLTDNNDILLEGTFRGRALTGKIVTFPSGIVTTTKGSPSQDVKRTEYIGKVLLIPSCTSSVIRELRALSSKDNLKSNYSNVIKYDNEIEKGHGEHVTLSAALKSGVDVHFPTLPGVVYKSNSQEIIREYLVNRYSSESSITSAPFIVGEYSVNIYPFPLNTSTHSEDTLWDAAEESIICMPASTALQRHYFSNNSNNNSNNNNRSKSHDDYPCSSTGCSSEVYHTFNSYVVWEHDFEPSAVETEGPLKWLEVADVLHAPVRD